MTPKECESIYNEAYRAVYWTAMSLLKNEADAEDVVQDTFVKMLESYDTLKDKTKVVPWLKKICANKCLNLLTRTRTYVEEQEFFENIEAVPEDFLPEAIIESEEKRKIIMDIINKVLSEDVRRTIILFYFDEMSTKEIAEAMGIPQGTVLWRLNFARHKIKKEVEKYEKETNTKLYVVPLPFLALLFMKEAEQEMLQPMPASLAELSASKEAAQTGAAENVVTETIKKGTGIAMKKLAVGFITVALLGAAITGIMLMKNREEEPKDRSGKNVVEQVSPSLIAEEKEPTSITGTEITGTEVVEENKQYKQKIETSYYVSNGIEEYSSRNVYDYDSNGDLIRSEHYDKTGEMKSWSEYEYDENGLKIKAIEGQRTDRDEPVEPRTYSYVLDEDGRVIKQTTYDSTGAIKSWIERTYDDAGREIAVKSYNGNGQLVRWEEREIDEFGNYSKYIMKHLDANGNPVVDSVEEAKTEVDEEGRHKKITIYKSGKVIHSSEATFDTEGNVTSDKQYSFSNGILTGWTETTYNSDGNKLDQKYYNVQDGTYSKKNEIEYVLDGEVLKVFLAEWYEFEYDDSGKLIRKLSHADDGRVDYRTEYEYVY